jgi:dihydroflavonol-4-reductase
MLLAREYEVRVLVSPDDPDPRSLKGIACETMAGSVTDPSAVSSAVRGMECVYHLAAKISLHPDRDGSVWKTNVEGTRTVASAAMEAGVHRFVHCSSHHALEKYPFDSPLTEDRPPTLNDPTTYHRSKAYAEVMIREFITAGLPAVIVNPGTVIGPYDFGPSLLAKALIDFYNQKIPFMMSGLSDYADARDICQGMIAALEKGRIGENYLLTGDMLSMRDLPILIEKITGKKLNRRVIPIQWMYRILPIIQFLSTITGKDPFFTRDMLHASQSNPVVSHEKAGAELEFKPRNIEAAFRSTFEWYKKMGWITF